MNVIVRCRPGLGQRRHIQILLRMGTPIQANRAHDVVMQHVLYDALTNAGLSSEYADEFINMEMDGGDSAW